MLGIFRTQRVLLYSGRSWDSEALLLSVLRHQLASSPTAKVAAVDSAPGYREARHDEHSNSFSLPQSVFSEVPIAESNRALLNSLRDNEGTSEGDPTRQRDEPCEGFSLTRSESWTPPARHPPPSREEGSASDSAADEELCFTLVAAQADPNATFPEILMQWERFVKDYGARYGEQLSPHIRRCEAALLNVKLDDPVLGLLVAMKGSSPPLCRAPKYIAEVLQTDSQRSAQIMHHTSAGDRWGACPSLGCYSLPHFSAELGDVGYLRSLLRQSPHGFPLRWVSSKPGHVHHDLTAGAGFDRAARSMDVHESDGPTSFDAADRVPQGQKRLTALRSFEWIAAQCPDHYGLYLSHLACFHGNIAYVAFLVDMLGADFVLQQQRCAAPISTSYTWGIQRYWTGLNATQCAVGGQQIALLEWIEAEHPSALQKMCARTTATALTTAAMSNDNKADVFDFFLSRHMAPINVLLTAEAKTVPADHRDAQLGAVGAWSEVFQKSHLFGILFAAAEVGNTNVLKWFDDALDCADVRLLCDSHGTTILHHCARGCNVELLARLLPASTENAPAEAGTSGLRWAPLEPRWVDLEDDRGRTPAMWCVMSSNKSKGVVETLEVLRRAGSDWPRARRNGASLLDVAMQFRSAHSKVVRYIRTHM